MYEKVSNDTTLFVIKMMTRFLTVYWWWYRTELWNHDDNDDDDDDDNDGAHGDKDNCMARIWWHDLMIHGGRLNIKMWSYQYRDPHVKDKTVSRQSYL